MDLEELLEKLPMHLSSLKKSGKDPESTISSAEDLIAKNPLNVAAHQMLANAFSELEMTESMVFAYETIRSISPETFITLKVWLMHT